MKKVIKFGEEVEGYNIPVLNEREIRASAGILFLMLFISLMFILSKGNFVPIKYAITIFLTDLLIRVFINPAYSPFLILGRLIVRKQTPEYVGAQQKKFAWIIGIVLASAMFVFFNVVNAYSIFTGLTCLVCLIFLFFETSFGICLGCKVYSLFYKEKAQYCPGEVCDAKSRQAIQKTSLGQILVVLAFIGYIILLGVLFNTHFSKPPHDLFGNNSSAQAK
jgi:predicted outer membrane lipoprotein